MNSAYQPDIGVSVHENLDVAQLADPLIDKEQNAVDHDDVGRRDRDGLVGAQMGYKIVDRLVD